MGSFLDSLTALARDLVRRFETASVPSDEGLVMTLDTSLLFRLSPGSAAQVYQKIGPNYVDVIVEPNMRSAIRSVTAAHSASALYTGGREEVAQRIYDELTKCRACY